MNIKEKWVSWEEFNALFPGLSPTSTINFESVGGLTEGSIPFADASGMLTQDNANLFWDETNAFLGIHEVVPTALVHINSVGGAIPALNLESGAEGEIVTPDGQQLRIGHWNGVDTFTERLKVDAAGLFYISYLVDHSVIFSGAGGEIKQDVANFYWDNIAKRLGIGRTPSNVLDVEGLGTDVGGVAGYTGVVARFHNTIAAKHTSISIDALTGYDPILHLAENGASIWDIRNDASASDEFQVRYQVGGANEIVFIILPTGDIQIPLGYLALMNGEELRFYDAGSSNYVGFEAPALGADQIWVLPNADGGAGEAIITDAGGNLSFTGSPVLLDSDFGSAGFMMTDGAGTYSIIAGGIDADHNVLMGAGAGTNLTPGQGTYNICIGENAGGSLTTADNVFCLGYQAGEFADTESNCIYIGLNAGRGGGAGQGGIWNIGIGVHSLMNINGAGNNTAVGGYSGLGCVTGDRNFFLGYGTGFTADMNDCVNIGYYASYFPVSAKHVCIGSYAGRGQVGANISNSIFIGYLSGGDVAGGSYYNVGIGTYTLQNLNGGIGNVVIGEYAGNAITSGDYNVIIGYFSAKTQITNQSNLLWIANTDTATPLIYGEFPNALLRVQATNFNVIGTCNLGDGGVTNYANIATDGTITLVGTARVTKLIILSTSYLERGNTAPDFSIDGSFISWAYDIGDDSVMTHIIPDDWAAGTDIIIKVHWFIDEAYAADKEVKWQCLYALCPHNETEAIDAPTHSGTLTSASQNIPAVAKRLTETTIGTIVAANISAGDEIGLTLSRIAQDNDAPTADPQVVHLEISYTANKIGT